MRKINEEGKNLEREIESEKRIKGERNSERKRENIIFPGVSSQFQSTPAGDSSP